jgi:serine/threonine protein kinase
MPFVIGETIGPYQLLEQLGQGGMATVYRAYHAALDRNVAIKALHPAFLEDPNFLARFQREARVVARLEHPNIVPVYDFSEHEGRPFLVMKFIEGETLKTVLHNHHPTLAETLPVVEAIGAALAYAHSQGILHRDIKPSNVLVTRAGQIYLADFGLARIAHAGHSTLTSDMMVGTPHYISPEQALARQDIDERSDIYSFGVMIYEMIVGRVPYSADTPFAIVHDHIYSPLPLPRQVNPNLPEPVERFLLKALAKTREDRFPDVNSMVAAYRAALALPGNAASGPVVYAPGPNVAQTEVLPAVGADVPGSGQPESWAAAPTRPEEAALARESVSAGRVPEEAAYLQSGFGLAGSGPPTATITNHPAAESPSLNSGGQVTASQHPTGLLPAEQQAAVQHPAAQKSTAAAPAPRKKPRVWVLALAGAAGLIALGLLIYAAVVVVQNVFPGTLISMEVATATNPPTPPAQDGANPPVDQPGVPLEQTAAWQTMKRSLDSYKKSNRAEALVQLNRAMTQAGENPDFYTKAGDWMASENAWPLAAVLYANLVRVQKGPLNEDQVQKIRESVYEAAGDAQLPAVEKVVRTAVILDIARARNELHHGDPAKAREMIEALAGKPDLTAQYPEILLLEAEMFWKLNDAGRAKELIAVLQQTPNLPEWIAREAESLLQAPAP